MPGPPPARPRLLSHSARTGRWVRYSGRPRRGRLRPLARVPAAPRRYGQPCERAVEKQWKSSPLTRGSAERRDTTGRLRPSVSMAEGADGTRDPSTTSSPTPHPHRRPHPRSAPHAALRHRPPARAGVDVSSPERSPSPSPTRTLVRLNVRPPPPAHPPASLGTRLTPRHPKSRRYCEEPNLYSYPCLNTRVDHRTSIYLSTDAPRPAPAPRTNTRTFTPHRTARSAMMMHFIRSDHLSEGLIPHR